MPKLNLTEAEHTAILKSRAEQALRDQGATEMLERIIAHLEEYFPIIGVSKENADSMINNLRLQRPV